MLGTQARKQLYKEHDLQTFCLCICPSLSPMTPSYEIAAPLYKRLVRLVEHYLCWFYEWICCHILTICLVCIIPPVGNIVSVDHGGKQFVFCTLVEAGFGLHALQKKVQLGARASITIGRVGEWVVIIMLPQPTHTSPYCNCSPGVCTCPYQPVTLVCLPDT